MDVLGGYTTFTYQLFLSETTTLKQISFVIAGAVADDRVTEIFRSTQSNQKDEIDQNGAFIEKTK